MATLKPIMVWALTNETAMGIENFYQAINAQNGSRLDSRRVSTLLAHSWSLGPVSPTPNNTGVLIAGFATILKPQRMD